MTEGTQALLICLSIFCFGGVASIYAWNNITFPASRNITIDRLVDGQWCVWDGNGNVRCFDNEAIARSYAKKL